MDLGSALLGFLTVVVLKGLVMLASVLLLVRLGRALRDGEQGRRWPLVPDEHRPELRLVWWSLALFLAAELGCAVGTAASVWSGAAALEVLHSVASATGMALFALGVYLYLDRKLLRFGAGRCLANRICRGCTLESGGACTFHCLLWLLAQMELLLALLPLWVPARRVSIDPSRVALPVESWNRWYDATVVPYLLANVPGYQPGGKVYFLPHYVMTLELRLLPGVAAVMALVALAMLLSRREKGGLRWLMATAGLLAYIYLELLVYAAAGDALLGSLAHETVELWFLACLWVFLRRAFPAEGSRT